ncbi:MAG: AAA family ATPase, partial [Candidatus Limnocylindrales bacterium]
MADPLERRAFVGRATERARLRSDLALVAGSGRARATVLAGESGIGKTSLLDQFLRDAATTGATLLVGACLEAADDGIPYAPFVEMLRNLVRHTPVERRPALLGPARADLSRLLPELAPRAADMPPASELDRSAQGRLFELILGIIERLAAVAAVVIVVEDIHWADRSTRDLLDFLVRSLRDEPVLLVVTLRTDTGGSAVGNLSFVAELEREPDVERIDLTAFTRDEVQAQATSLLGRRPDGGEIDALLARSDGNPFSVEELVVTASGSEGLPPVLRDVLSARISSLSRPALDVLRAAAIAGRGIDDDLISEALAVDPRTLGGHLREAIESGILVRGSGRDGPAVRFRHVLLQEVVASDLFPAERAALHAAFAAALERRAAGKPGSATHAEIARHWDAAGRPDRALGPTLRGAEAAERAFAFGEALRLWDRAAVLLEMVPDQGPRMLSTGGAEPVEPVEAAEPVDPSDRVLPRRDELLERAAECAVLAGEYDRAVELGREAVGLVDETSEPARAGHLHDRLRWYLWESGDREAARRAVEAALELIPESPASAGRARALTQHAGILLLASDYSRAVDEANRAIEHARAADAPGEEAMALGILGWCQAVLGDPASGIARFREGEAIATGLGSVEGMAMAAASLASLLDRIGHSDASLEAASAGYAMTDRLGVA